MEREGIGVTAEAIAASLCWPSAVMQRQVLIEEGRGRASTSYRPSTLPTSCPPLSPHPLPLTPSRAHLSLHSMSLPAMTTSSVPPGDSRFELTTPFERLPTVLHAYFNGSTLQRHRWYSEFERIYLLQARTHYTTSSTQWTTTSWCQLKGALRKYRHDKGFPAHDLAGTFPYYLEHAARIPHLIPLPSVLSISYPSLVKRQVSAKAQAEIPAEIAHSLQLTSPSLSVPSIPSPISPSPASLSMSVVISPPPPPPESLHFPSSSLSSPSLPSTPSSPATEDNGAHPPPLSPLTFSSLDSADELSTLRPSYSSPSQSDLSSAASPIPSEKQKAHHADVQLLREALAAMEVEKQSLQRAMVEQREEAEQKAHRLQLRLQEEETEREALRTQLSRTTAALRDICQHVALLHRTTAWDSHDSAEVEGPQKRRKTGESPTLYLD